MLKSKHLLSIFLPAILVVSFALFIRFLQYLPTTADNSQEQATENTKQIQIPIFPNDPIVGDKKAPITLVLFSDLACGGCQEQEGLFAKLMEKYPKKIKIVWKGLPVTDFPIPSRTAHAFAFCANEQNKFNEFKTMAFANKENLSPETLKILADKTGLNPEKLAECLASPRPETYTKTTEDLATLMNIQTVPTFFINNIQIKAPQTVEGWEALLQL